MEAAKTTEIIDKPLPPISKEKMDEALQKLKDNIVKPQKVCGKEFKGPSFISSPPIIEFIDFQPDQTYTLKITLTNISYSFNSYKILPINKEFRDFFLIEYTPAGRMSAGLSSIVTITFNPKINADINSELPLLTETGDVVIPIKCTCKKAIVSSKSESVAFGEVFYGDSATANYTIENTGALGTDFKIVLRDK